MNFKVIHRAQDSNGKHTSFLLGDNGDTVVVNSADYFEGDECSLRVYPPDKKVSASPVVVAQAAEQGQTSAGLTDAQPRQHSDSVSEKEKEH